MFDLASSLNITEEESLSVLESDYPPDRRALALNPRITLKIQDIILKSHEYLLYDLCFNDNLHLDIQNEMLRIFPKSPTHADLIRVLAENPSVYESVQHDIIEVTTSYASKTIRLKALASNTGVRESTCLKLIDKVGLKDIYVLCELAKNPNITYNVQKALLDATSDVKSDLAGNLSVDPTIQMMLINDESQEVLKSLYSNENLCEEARNILITRLSMKDGKKSEIKSIISKSSLSEEESNIILNLRNKYSYSEIFNNPDIEKYIKDVLTDIIKLRRKTNGF